MNRKEWFCKLAFLCALPAGLLFAGCNAKEETKPVTEAVPRGEIETVSASGISGKIILQGTPPPEREMQMDSACGKLHTAIPKTRLYVVAQDGGLADVFIYIKEGLSGKTCGPPAETVLLDQIACEYTPYVLGLQTGQTLLVRNSDPIMHNVHPIPKVGGNRESNRAQMPKSKDYEYTFDKPEIFLTYKCDVHPWMYAYVGVVDHPFFAVSASDGTFNLKNVPDGKYIVEAHHRKAGKQTKEITVADGKSAALNFAFELPAQ